MILEILIDIYFISVLVFVVLKKRSLADVCRGRPLN